MSIARIEGRRILIHPDDRWSLSAMRAIAELGLPVVLTDFMPRGKLYVADPEEVDEPAPDRMFDF